MRNVCFEIAISRCPTDSKRRTKQHFYILIAWVLDGKCFKTETYNIFVHFCPNIQ